MKEENKAPTTQVSANPNLFNTRKDTGVARVTTRANPTTTTKTTSAVFMAVLLWWMYVNTSRLRKNSAVYPGPKTVRR